MQLKEVLQKRGISRLQLALRAGVPPSYLYSALSGKVPLFPAYRKKIAEFLGVDENELFESEEQSNDDRKIDNQC